MKKDSQKNSSFLFRFLFLLLILTGLLAVGALAKEPSGSGFTQIKKSGKYYWKKPNGKIRTKKGWFDVNGNTYYLAKGGACYTGYKKVNQKLYSFTKKGVLQKKTGWFTDRKYTYYYNRDSSLATGRIKINGKYYIFGTANGRLQKNKSSVRIGNVYYKTDKNGVASKINGSKERCSQAAQKFIRKHSGSSKSRAARFRSCFNYLVAHMKYTPGYYSVREDYARINKKDFQYNLALEMFNSPFLRGNCHRFACCVAAVAKELGYDPYVVVTAGDHSFVMINGRYYDNMGPLFGAKKHRAYTVYKKVKM